MKVSAVAICLVLVTHVAQARRLFSLRKVFRNGEKVVCTNHCVLICDLTLAFLLLLFSATICIQSIFCSFDAQEKGKFTKEQSDRVNALKLIIHPIGVAPCPETPKATTCEEFEKLTAACSGVLKARQETADLFKAGGFATEEDPYNHDKAIDWARDNTESANKKKTKCLAPQKNCCIKGVPGECEVSKKSAKWVRPSSRAPFLINPPYIPYAYTYAPHAYNTTPRALTTQFEVDGTTVKVKFTVRKDGVVTPSIKCEEYAKGYASTEKCETKLTKDQCTKPQ